MADDTKATPREVKAFFEAGGREMKLQEMTEMKRADPDGWDQIAHGIGDGTFTY